MDRHVPPKPSHSIFNTGALRSTHLRVHHVCGAEHAVFLRPNTHGSKREHVIREFIGARLVVDVLPSRIVLVLVINSWFTLNGYTILSLSYDGKFFKASSGLPMWSVDAVIRHHHLLDDAAHTLVSHITCLLSANVCLAAIVISSVIPLVAFQQAIMLWRAKKVDLFLWVTSFLGVLFIGVLEGIAIAVILTLVVVVYESARPQMVVLWHIPGTSIYCNMKQENAGGFVPNVLSVLIGSSMYFVKIQRTSKTHSSNSLKTCGK